MFRHFASLLLTESLICRRLVMGKPFSVLCICFDVLFSQRPMGIHNRHSKLHSIRTHTSDSIDPPLSVQ